MSAKPRIKAPTQSEAQLHKAVAQYLAKALRPPTIWTSIDAGQGKMTPRAAFQRKLRGVQPGWPDILVIAPGPVVVAIELKAKVGRQSPEQKIVAKALWDCKAPYYLCRSVGDVQMSLEDCRVPLHAKVTT